MQADGRQFELAPERPVIEGLDILQRVLEPVSPRVDLVICQRVKSSPPSCPLIALPVAGPLRREERDSSTGL